MASSDVNPASPEASKSSCGRKACRSSNGSVSKRQNHCDEPLVVHSSSTGYRRRGLQTSYWRHAGDGSKLKDDRFASEQTKTATAKVRKTERTSPSLATLSEFAEM